MNSNIEIARIRAAYARWEGTLDKSNPGFRMSVLQRDRVLNRWLERNFPSDLRHCRILDIGCGVGELLGWFHDRGARAENLFGVDLLPHRIAAARQNYSGFTFIEGTAEQLDFANAWFDIVTAPVISHAKANGQLDRNFLAGVRSDAISA